MCKVNAFFYLQPNVVLVRSVHNVSQIFDKSEERYGWSVNYGVAKPFSSKGDHEIF
jgi:hypothetical protein